MQSPRQIAIVLLLWRVLLLTTSMASPDSRAANSCCSAVCCLQQSHNDTCVFGVSAGPLGPTYLNGKSKPTRAQGGALVPSASFCCAVQADKVWVSQRPQRR